jgi:ABC-type polysaccharide/polyol phosphate export permease
MTMTGFDRRDLRMLFSLFRMNLTDRFLGSSLGLIWAVLSPLLLMGTFCVVFAFVFPSRLPNTEGSLPFIIWLISGYAPWLFISDGMSSATGSVTGNAGVVKNIAFKSELLPVVGSMMGLVPMTVGLLIVFGLQFFVGDGIHSAVLILPLVIVLQLFFIAGAGLFLGALNVFVRDTSFALPTILTLGLFASPIFYQISAFPEAVRDIVIYNPFYVIAECYRLPIISGELPPLWMLVYLALLSGGLFLAGLWWFRRLKSFFDTRL